MNLDALYSELTLKTDAKLALVVLDGLGDLATGGPDSWTPLEAARTPNLDALTQRAAQGRMTPVAPGITPGSGPGHLALFGYDPLEYQVGRGVIEALGLGITLRAGDVAARANFCTLDPRGVVTDRRAGRIETEVCEELCAVLARKIKKIGDAEVLIRRLREHDRNRFAIPLRHDSAPHAAFGDLFLRQHDRSSRIEPRPRQFESPISLSQRQHDTPAETRFFLSNRQPNETSPVALRDITGSVSSLPSQFTSLRLGFEFQTSQQPLKVIFGHQNIAQLRYVAQLLRN